MIQNNKSPQKWEKKKKSNMMSNLWIIFYSEKGGDAADETLSLHWTSPSVFRNKKKTIFKVFHGFFHFKNY